jgi:lipopolysaccharide transport system ATP-binding protein
MKPAIRVDGLSKHYRIGAREHGGYRTLRESMAEAAGAGWRRARRLVSRRAREDEKREEAETSLWALKDVSFDVQPGEVVGIIGRNGAGKSTLLKILSRITEPTEGRVEVRGRMSSLLEVGTGFHPELTGRENIYLNGSVLGMTHREIARKFDEIVAFSEVERFLDTPVKRYSSGMYVRLAFAVAAHLDPEILVVDEVLAVGDLQFQKKCLGKMGDVAKGGKTVIFVSHNLPTVSLLCQRAVWLSDGRVCLVDRARSVVEKYMFEVVRRNAVEIDLTAIGREDATSGSVRLTRLEWLSPLPLRHGEDVCLRLHYRASATVEEVAFGLGFSTSEGRRFLTLDSDHNIPRQRVEVGEVGWVELTIPAFPIAPGHYLLDVGVRSGDRVTVDSVQGAVQLEVVCGRDTPSFIEYYPNVGVRLSGGWLWGS